MAEEMGAVTVKPLEEMLEKLHAGAVFGEPVVEGEVTLIPLAEVTFGFGYGQGYGRAPKPAAEEGAGTEEEAEAAEEESAEGGGGGGGAGGRVTPLGYVKITPEGVTFEETTNDTRIAMAGIALGAWAVFWVGRVLNSLIKAVGARRAAG